MVATYLVVMCLVFCSIKKQCEQVHSGCLLALDPALTSASLNEVKLLKLM
jgi:hypothetical protein